MEYFILIGSLLNSVKYFYLYILSQIFLLSMATLFNRLENVQETHQINILCPILQNKKILITLSGFILVYPLNIV